MPKYERPKGRSSSPKHSFSRRSDSDRGSFRDGPRRSFGRDSDSGRGRDRGNLEMTKVICASCNEECEVPFKPTSSKPVYCRDCFEKKEKGGFGRGSSDRRNSDRRGSFDRGGSDRPSSSGLDIINEKLDKIIAALKIK